MSLFTEIDARLSSAESSVKGFVNDTVGAGKTALNNFMNKNLGISDPNSTKRSENIGNVLTIKDRIDLGRSGARTNIITYPEDLYDPARGDQYAYIIFHILVNSESKFAKEKGNSAFDANYVGASSGSNSSIVGNSALADAVLAGGGKMIQGALNSVVSTGKGLLNSVGLNTAAKDQGDSTNNSTKVDIEKIGKDLANSLSKTMKKLNTSIALPMPNALQAQYSASYSSAGLGMVGAIFDRNSNMEGLKNMFSSTGNMGKLVTAFVPGQLGDLARQKAGVMVNPRKETIFNDIEKRKFQYEFEFAPSSYNEYQNALKIINTFKIHMHPEFFDSNKLMYTNPDEFDIEYHYGDSQNPALHRVSTCYLTDMSVNYANGGWSNHEDGYPTHIHLQLSFSEIETLTRERIREFEIGTSAGNTK